jgi:hypothetical protein
MQTQHRSPALTFGAATRQATGAMVVMLALCTPALGQSTAPQPLARAMTREANQLVAAGAATRVNAAQSRPTRTPRKRLGKWAVIPGIFVGAFLGAAVDCSLNGCGPGSPNIPAGVGPVPPLVCRCLPSAGNRRAPWTSLVISRRER